MVKQKKNKEKMSNFDIEALCQLMTYHRKVVEHPQAQ